MEILSSSARRNLTALCASLLLMFALSATARAQTTAFTYQGRLTDSSAAANGTYDLQFALYDQAAGGVQQPQPTPIFFVEREFQDTGFAAYRLYKATYGRAPAYLEYTKARSQIQAGATLSATKGQLADALLSTPQVRELYDGKSNAEYVDATFANTGIAPGSTERQAIIGALDAGMESRATTLVKIADTQAFVDAEYNAAFVTMQYFGYLRRDAEAEGFRFWLDVLNNRVPNNYRGMVCAFITSREYQLRFGSVVTRTDRVCGP